MSSPKMFEDQYHARRAKDQGIYYKHQGIHIDIKATGNTGPRAYRATSHHLFWFDAFPMEKSFIVYGESEQKAFKRMISRIDQFVAKQKSLSNDTNHELLPIFT